MIASKRLRLAAAGQGRLFDLPFSKYLASARINFNLSPIYMEKCVRKLVKIIDDHAPRAWRRLKRGVQGAGLSYLHESYDQNRSNLYPSSRTSRSVAEPAGAPVLGSALAGAGSPHCLPDSDN